MFCSSVSLPPRTNFTVCTKNSIIPSKKAKNEYICINHNSNLLLQKSFAPLALSLTILLSSNSAQAGLMSGSTGIESVPGPKLPQIDFLNRFNEENQKKYAEADARFKSSPFLQEFLEKSKLNKEKNKQEIQDKYCIRGAEWGVGDCSTVGMTEDEKNTFIAMLKKKAGVTD